MWYSFKLKCFYLSWNSVFSNDKDIQGAPKKGYPTSLRYLISVYNELLQKTYSDVLDIGLMWSVRKMGDIASWTKKLKQFLWYMIFISQYMNITRNCRKSNSDLKLHSFDDYNEKK